MSFLHCQHETPRAQASTNTKPEARGVRVGVKRILSSSFLNLCPFLLFQTLRNPKYHPSAGRDRVPYRLCSCLHLRARSRDNSATSTIWRTLPYSSPSRTKPLQTPSMLMSQDKQFRTTTPSFCSNPMEHTTTQAILQPLERP